MYKVMVVEDDDNISKIICKALEKEGFFCHQVVEFDKVIDDFIAFSPELVLMDINLPGNDGFYWCEKIRRLSKAPLIFISARSTDMDIITATNMGGDDYLIKPFSIAVLVAKVKGVLRRAYSYKEEELHVISYGEVFLNMDNGVVQYKGQEMELTHNEKEILGILLKNQGKIVRRERIMRSLWQDESFIDDNTLTVNITRIRKKLKEMGCDDFIRTVRNEGYLI